MGTREDWHELKSLRPTAKGNECKLKKKEAEEWGGILLERLKFFGAVLLFLMIDCLFLIAWFALHWVLGKGQEWFALVGAEKVASFIIRALLEVPTVVLIGIFIVADMKRITFRVFYGAAQDLSKGGIQHAPDLDD